MLVDDPDETVVCRLSACGRCAGDLAGAGEYASQRRQVFEVPPPKPYVTEYQVQPLICPGCDAVTRGEAPEGVNGRVQRSLTATPTVSPAPLMVTAIIPTTSLDRIG
jgi:transposase